MIGSPLRRSLPSVGAAWLALTASELLLQACAPRSVWGDPLLSFGAKAALLCTESFLIALALVPFLLLALLEARLAERWKRSLLGFRISYAGLLLWGLLASWSVFWLSGQFLDRTGLIFASSNFSTIHAFAARMHPFLTYVAPMMAMAVAIGSVVWAAPRLSECRPLAWTAGVLIGLCLPTAVVGARVQQGSTDKTTDPATGAVYSRAELFRLRRERNAGPLTHVFARLGTIVDPLDDGPAPLPEAVRRPIVPLADYLAGVDRDRLKRWNVLVVLVDSLRADQIVACGGVREVMPALEALGRDGRVFSDCTTQATHTDYSMPAVFSSHYPLRSRDVYRYPKHPAYPRVMIYDVLKALGWRTAIFSSQNDEWGQMDQYLDTGSLDAYVHSKSAGVPQDATPDRPALAGVRDDRLTITDALSWIESGPAPFFLFLNLQNSHLPYDVPAEFPRRFGPARVDFKISVGWYPEDKTAVVKDVYADSLAYVDSQLDRLFRRLRERGEWERTLVVVSGDHGEAFYEHGTAAHANGVHEEVARVPLLFRAPGLDARREVRPTQLIDVAPGVFHLLGLPIHPSFQGVDPFAGAGDPGRTRFLISDTPWKTVLGVRRGDFKLIRDGDSGACVLYDLARDPFEKTDASLAHPGPAADLKARLSAWRRLQLEYYGNPVRQATEYPPVLRDP